MAEIGLAGGAEESGVGGQASRLGHKGAGLVTYQPHLRPTHSTSPHPDQPLRPIAPPKGKGGNGLCLIHSCLRLIAQESTARPRAHLQSEQSGGKEG